MRLRFLSLQRLAGGLASFFFSSYCSGFLPRTMNKDVHTCNLDSIFLLVLLADSTRELVYNSKRSFLAGKKSLQCLFLKP